MFKMKLSQNVLDPLSKYILTEFYFLDTLTSKTGVHVVFVGGVRFIKWAQDSLVSFVKCDPPSILPCSGNKHYNAFKDVLAPICIFRHC